jgi:AraC-like DNA-binding protein
MQNPRLNAIHAPRTLNVTYARVLVGHLQQTRPELLHLLDARQLGHLDQLDPLARCSLQEWHQLMDVVEQLLGSGDLVPALAAQFKPWHAGLLGFTLMTCGTVGELAVLLKRFHHLLNDVFAIEHGLEGPRFFLRLQPATSERSLRLARLSLCVWAQRMRWLTGQPDLILDASFEGPPPGDLAAYRQIFKGAVRFDQDSNTLWGAANSRELLIVSRDTTSHSLLHGQALKQLESLSTGEDRFIEQLQGLIKARLDVGKVTLEEVAAELKLPPRTLQRRLEEASLNFRWMVDDVRRSQAQHLLRDTSMSLAELASALGFADPASFNRAFKRWTSLSPGAFRRSQGGRQPAPAPVAS